MRGRLLCALIALLILAGCSGLPLSPQLPEPQVHTSPLALALSPIATPAVSGAAQANRIPTPNPNLASIGGSIAMQGYPHGTLPADLYLGDPSGSDPVGAYIALDTATAPKGYVRSDGTFVFPNLSPGTYAILVWTPAGAYIVPDPTTGTAWLIEIKGNANFDAGQIMVPPIEKP